jgi:hypothetical protein
LVAGNDSVRWTLRNAFSCTPNSSPSNDHRRGAMGHIVPRKRGTERHKDRGIFADTAPASCAFWIWAPCRVLTSEQGALWRAVVTIVRAPASSVRFPRSKTLVWACGTYESYTPFLSHPMKPLQGVHGTDCTSRHSTGRHC